MIANCIFEVIGGFGPVIVFHLAVTARDGASYITSGSACILYECIQCIPITASRVCDSCVDISERSN